MKIKKTVFALVLAVAAVVSFAAGAAAASNLKEIKAFLSYDITIKYDGEEQVMTDANGARIYPIVYNGTTYLPIRATATLLDVGVNWEQATQTILLGDPADGVDLIDTHKAYFLTDEYGLGARQLQTADKESKEISGITCSHWLALNLGRYAAKNSLCAGSFNVGGKYDTVTFQYYSDKNVTLRVLGDNDSVLAEIPVTGGQAAHSITVDLHQSSQLTFQAEKLIEPAITQDQDTHVFIFDARLK
ncbi:hypothetical protein D1159_03230 [Pseudoflavonifractor sp. 524-17]|uniref:stalk domain-containing protein n=1 Tax=Pseudoflavonifractor sp. 524-17 TaxID=2304577 RepID=UPI00137A7B04|nr:hypothetical protein [Pseudoflavonifractor sp. 524-17]NCE63614.1 hypothetical protein [Pseudoflavonifractor sp. 524-17]